MLSKARLAYLPGMAAGALLFISWLLTGIVYRGREGESFSPLNHFVSELGQPGVSRFSSLFNASMIIGGVLMILFMIGLAFYMRGLPAYIGSCLGALTAVSAILIGFLPINHGATHTAVSILFFFGALSSVIIFNLVIATDHSGKISKRLILPGFISFALFTLLILAIRADPSPTGILDPAIAARPAIWMIAVLEWLAVVSLVAWVLSFSIYLKIKTARPDQE